jgi:hypothetical protein
MKIILGSCRSPGLTGRHVAIADKTKRPFLQNAPFMIAGYSEIAAKMRDLGAGNVIKSTT